MLINNPFHRLQEERWLIGPKALAISYESRPGSGIKMTKSQEGSEYFSQWVDQNFDTIFPKSRKDAIFTSCLEGLLAVGRLVVSSVIEFSSELRSQPGKCVSSKLSATSWSDLVNSPEGNLKLPIW
jgi:hypothetical protein